MKVEFGAMTQPDQLTLTLQPNNPGLPGLSRVRRQIAVLRPISDRVRPDCGIRPAQIHAATRCPRRYCVTHCVPAKFWACRRTVFDCIAKTLALAGRRPAGNHLRNGAKCNAQLDGQIILVQDYGFQGAKAQRRGRSDVSSILAGQ